MRNSDHGTLPNGGVESSCDDPASLLAEHHGFDGPNVPRNDPYALSIEAVSDNIQKHPTWK